MEKPENRVFVMAVLLILMVYELHSQIEVSQAPLITILPYHKTKFETEFYGMVFEGEIGNLIDNSVFYKGAFEKPLLFMMRDIAQNIGPDTIYFDVGANVGQHSLFMSKYAKVVHAFEPYPPVISRFKRLMAINSINNVVLHELGLGDSNQILPFYAPDESNHGLGGFVKTESNDNDKPSLQLRIVTADEVLGQLQLSRMDIVKIDIEGYEKLAIKGMRNSLEKFRPILVLEVSTTLPMSYHSKSELLSSLPSNYEIDELLLIDEITGDYRLRKFPGEFSTSRSEELPYYYNIVVYPSEKAGLLPEIPSSLDSPLSTGGR